MDWISTKDFNELVNGNGKRTATNRNRVFRKATNVERAQSNAPSEAKRCQPFDSQVNVTFLHYRHRLADVDGVSIKACLDGIVKAGLLKDDSCSEINEVRQRQIKIASSEDEKTEIIIEVVQPEGRLI
jgi:Holliday junction resolvase RusA-like endonuclease